MTGDLQSPWSLKQAGTALQIPDPEAKEVIDDDKRSVAVHGISRPRNADYASCVTQDA